MLPGSQDHRTEFSHTVHADNCNLFPSGECERAYPSYTERDYSAIIYLNSNIEGGEFVFVSDYKGEDVQVRCFFYCNIGTSITVHLKFRAQ